MGGKEYAVSAVLHRIPEYLYKLVPGNRVKPAGGFVQNKQPGVVGKSQRQREFYLHSGGKLL